MLRAETFNWEMDLFALSSLSNSRPLTAITYNAFKVSKRPNETLNVAMQYGKGCEPSWHVLLIDHSLVTDRQENFPLHYAMINFD